MLFCHWTKVDWIALLFCKNTSRFKDLQNLIEHSDYKIPIIAK
jgi:hypothetical protein